MFTLRTWGRILLVALMLFIAAPMTSAQQTASKTRTTDTTHTTETSAEPRQPAGSPEFGFLIIIGIVGFVILVAWIFSRAGEGGSRQGSHTMN
jgi:hypothetical protein